MHTDIHALHTHSYLHTQEYAHMQGKKHEKARVAELMSDKNECQVKQYEQK